MPNCYQYLKNGEAVPLAALDDAVRRLLGAPPDPKRFHPDFEYGVSLRVACGQTLEQVANDDDAAPEAQRIARYLLDSGYQTTAWVQVGK